MQKTLTSIALALLLTGCAGRFVSMKHHDQDMREINAFFKAQRDLDSQFINDVNSQNNMIRILANENLDFKNKIEALEKKLEKVK